MNLAKNFFGDDLLAGRDFFNDVFNVQTSGLRHHQDGETLTVSFDVPGVAIDDLDASVHGGVVTVKADTGDRNYLYRVRVRNVDTEKVEHSLENGVLTLTFPLASVAKELNILAKKEEK